MEKLAFELHEKEAVRIRWRQEPEKKRQSGDSDIVADLLDGGQADRISGESEDCDIFEPDENSDDDDFFDIQMAARTSLSDAYVKCPRMQWILATEELSEQLREEALLPTQLTDADSGMSLPRWHCVFEGCGACAEAKNKSELNQEKGIWQHIWSEEGKHRRALLSL